MPVTNPSDPNGCARGGRAARHLPPRRRSGASPIAPGPTRTSGVEVERHALAPRVRLAGEHEAGLELVRFQRVVADPSRPGPRRRRARHVPQTPPLHAYGASGAARSAASRIGRRVAATLERRRARRPGRSSPALCLGRGAPLAATRPRRRRAGVKELPVDVARRRRPLEQHAAQRPRPSRSGRTGTTRRPRRPRSTASSRRESLSASSRPEERRRSPGSRERTW